MTCTPYLLSFPMANILIIFGKIDLLRLMYNVKSMVGFVIAVVYKTDRKSVVNNMEEWLLAFVWFRIEWMHCLISWGVKFQNMSIVTGLDIETVVATAVTIFVRSIVLVFMDIFNGCVDNLQDLSYYY